MLPIDKVREEGEILKTEVRERTLGYILTALGLVAGLAWNEAIKSTINLAFPAGRDTVWAQFIYAIAITIAVVVIATYLTRYFAKKKVE